MVELYSEHDPFKGESSTSQTDQPNSPHSDDKPTDGERCRLGGDSATNSHSGPGADEIRPEYCQPPVPNPTLQTAAIFVDLDDTLLRTDTLWEALLIMARTQPASLFILPIRLFRGRAYLESYMARCIELTSARIPFRESVLEFIRNEKREDVMIILATASDQRWAHQITDKLDVFHHVIAIDGETNLKGGRKLKTIQEFCAFHGVKEFTYIGDSAADIPIWNKADRAVLVNPSNRILRRVASERSLMKPLLTIRDQKSNFLVLLKAVRAHQWGKNMLMFMPLMLAFNLSLIPSAGAVILGFGAFSACASAVYLLNDLLDLPSDRKHPRKRTRPLAAGDLSLKIGILLAVCLLVTGVGLSYAVSSAFLITVGVYLAMTTLYTAWLKKKVLIDVLVLASLYTIRVIAGGIAAKVSVSEWLLAFSLFLFTSLGFVKRYSELMRLKQERSENAEGRGYQTSDISIIESIGISCGFISVLVLVLYIHSDDVTKIYAITWPLWLACIFVMYWVGRIWIQARRGFLREDPVIFALTDKVSLATAGIVFLLMIIAKFGLNLAPIFR